MFHVKHFAPFLSPAERPLILQGVMFHVKHHSLFFARRKEI